MILPQLIERTGVKDLVGMKGASSPYNALFHRLLFLAEQARVDLSSCMETDLDFELTVDGESYDMVMTIRRAELEVLIEPHVVRSLDLVQRMLDRTGTPNSALSYILPVGGTTYTPYVRTMLQNALGIPLRTEMNPTTAVAVGAAVFAGQQRNLRMPFPASDAKTDKPAASASFVYARMTQNPEELLIGRVDGASDGDCYRLTRDDGGYDSGLKGLDGRIVEPLPLVPHSLNRFRFELVGADGGSLPCGYDPIEIAQGRFALVGQPLPHDLCIEVDEPLLGETRLEQLFASNSILPLRKTFTRAVSKTIETGTDDFLSINIYEGSAVNLPAASRCIGQIRITGKELARILIQGSDLHLTVEVDESREIKVSAWVEMTEQKFEQVFRYDSSSIEIERLRDALGRLRRDLDLAIDKAAQEENFEHAKMLSGIRDDLNFLRHRADALVDDDVTDAKYQIDATRRALMNRMAQTTADASLNEALRDYELSKQGLLAVLGSVGQIKDRADAEALFVKHAGLASIRSPIRYRIAEKELDELHHALVWRLPGYQEWLFGRLQNMEEAFSDPRRARKLLREGEEAVRNRQQPRLAFVNTSLMSLLPEDVGKETVREARRVGIF